MVETNNVRIKFYSKDDLSCSWFLQDIERFLEHETKIIDNVNDIIELFNIKKFFDNRVYLKTWDENTRKKYASVVNDYPRIIFQFFSNISRRDLFQYYSQLEDYYKRDYWEILDTFKIIDKNANLIQEDDFTLEYAYDFLYRKRLLNKYSEIVKRTLLKDPFLLETIINCDNAKIKDINMPLFNNDELERIVINYINEENANPNYLEYIYNIGRIRGHIIDPMVRIEAIKKKSQFVSKLPKESRGGLSFGIEVIFKDSEEVRTISHNGLKCTFVFDEKWFKENSDYPTLLNNFIHVFEFVDSEYRASFSKLSSTNESLISRIGIHTLQEYTFGIDKLFLEMYSTIILKAYIDYLKKLNINIEDIIQWFFTIYLKDEFNVKGFIFNKTTSEATYLEKCRMLFAELDGILKQFDFYCKYKHINREALDIYQSLRSSRIPSLIEGKYVYCQNEKLLNYIYIINSNNSVLNVNHKNKKYSSFVDLISQERIELDLFEEYQQRIIKDLIDEQVIDNNDNCLAISSEKRYIFRDIYENGVISFHHLRFGNGIVDEYLNKGFLKKESTLLTKEESNYFDYMLNNQIFDNSRAIRNSYMHGTNSLNKDDHINTYLLIIKLIIVLMIKINDEFVTIHKDM